MLRVVILAAVIISSTFSSAYAQAATIWTDWTSAIVGTAGGASGSLGSITVSYSGEVLSGSVVNGTANQWNPASSFVGGAVDSSPDAVGDIIGVNGSGGPTPITGTITFSSPVSNPVMAIWSLGRTTVGIDFTFDETPTLQAGGPNDSFGGSSLVVNGNTVSGKEGNGVVLFNGTFTGLSWTSGNEHWYGFTVGAVQTVPVPAALWLFASGLLGLFGLARR